MALARVVIPQPLEVQLGMVELQQTSRAVGLGLNLSLSWGLGSE